MPPALAPAFTFANDQLSACLVTDPIPDSDPRQGFLGPRYCSVPLRRYAVAKGQMRSNREKKKPKQEKPKAAPAGTFASTSSNPASSAYAAKRK
jgi:hypothetical protein